MLVIGIDEVGRGCWAGPVVAGAVMLLGQVSGLRDSKRLSKIQRETLNLLIIERASYGLGWVMPAELDSIGLTKAVALAMERALQAIDKPYDHIIIDGNYNFLKHLPNTQTLIRADDVIPAVSAASIIAKVARDNYMIKAAEQYPGYGFDTNVGYGTAKHVTGLQRYGVTRLHRRSFKPIKALL